MIRAVVDTNVRFSAILTPDGTAAKCLRILSQSHHVVVSERLLEEFANTVRRKLQYTEQEIAERFSAIRAKCELVSPHLHLANICRDPDDNRVIECAMEGKADYIVTGDSDLLTLARYNNIQIVTPSQLLRSVENLHSFIPGEPFR